MADILSCAAIVSPTSWYQGCYSVKEISSSLAVWLSGNWNLLDCTQKCFLQGYTLAGMSNASKCLCTNSTTDFTEGQPSVCDKSCSVGVDFQCGGESSDQQLIVSLYQSLGPYITNSSLLVIADNIVINRPLALDASAELGKVYNFTDGSLKIKMQAAFFLLLDETDEGREIVSFSWSIDDKEFIVKNVTSDNRLVRCRMSYVFHSSGIHQIRVHIKNAISEKVHEMFIDVLLPKPLGLQISLVDTEYHQPSCVPPHVEQNSGMAMVAIFQNHAEVFEASLSVGTNVTFLWFFSDTNQQYTYYSAKELVSMKNHSFSRVGVFLVAVTVTNQYGTITKNLSVIVQSQHLETLSFKLPPNSNKFYQVSEPVHFLVSFFTATREDTLLLVNFGDGNQKMFILDANHTSHSSDCEAPVLLRKDYGDGCNLQGEICYTYSKPGIFTAHITAKNNISSVEATMDPKLIVYQKIETAVILSSIFIPKKRISTFLLKSPILSGSQPVRWLVRSKGQIFYNSTDLPYIKYTFADVGQYVVSAVYHTVKGGQEKIEKTVYVKEPIRNVTIQSVDNFFLQTGQSVTFCAHTSLNSLVNFHWNIAGKIYSLPKNLTSCQSHIFKDIGEFDVSVSSTNEVSNVTATLKRKILVQEPIEFLELEVVETLSINIPVLLCVRVVSGSDFNLLWNLGNSLQMYNLVSKDGGHTCIKHTFTTLGFLNISVVAFNHISNLTESTEVFVEEPLMHFDVDILRPTLPGVPVMFVIRTADVFKSFPHLTYSWDFSNNVSLKTAWPVITLDFPSPGRFHVDVTAYNFVNISKRSRDFYINPIGTPEVWIENPTYAAVGEEVNFQLKGLQSTGSEDIVVKYSDGTTETLQQNIPLSWTHIFQKTGLNEVSVQIVGKSSAGIIQGTIYIDELLKDVSLHGSAYVNILKNSSWEVVFRGSPYNLFYWNVTYLAATDHSTLFTTCDSKLSSHLSHPGIYNVSVRIENSISRQNASMTVESVYPVLKVIPSANYGEVNKSVMISFTVYGSSALLTDINFGDGKRRLLTKEDLIQSTYYSNSTSHEYPGATIHNFMLEHIYAADGQYQLEITAYNKVSSIKNRTTIPVYNPITGPRIETNSSRVISLDESVIVTAYVASGDNLTFEWDCFPDDCFLVDAVSVDDYGFKVVVFFFIFSESHSSSAEFRFFEGGKEYEVWVLVKMPEMYIDLPFKFAPVQTISKVDISPYTRKYSTPLYHDIIPFTSEIAFEASCFGSNITFEFDYGDGENVDIVLGDWMGDIQTATSYKTFTKEGIYSITLLAKNPLGNVTVKMDELFYVMYPPENLRIEATNKSYLLGSNITFQGFLGSGTNISFDWSLGDQTELIDAGLNITHHYLTSGRKIVTLHARNKVQTISVSVEVYGWNKILGIHLKNNGSIIKGVVKEPILFEAELVPNLKHTLQYMKWDVGNNKNDILTVNPSYETKYYRSGRYTVTAEAYNDFSKAVSEPVEVQIFSRLISLEMIINGPVIVNFPIEFSSYYYSGSDLNFWWNFGDGTPMEYERTVYHEFNRSGVYDVNLTVFNEISKSIQIQKLFVLEFPCNPPEVNILGSSNQIVQRSKDVHIEPVVTVDCSNKRALLYTWTIKNNVTGEMVKPKNIASQVFHERILFLPRLTLEYGNYSVELIVKINETIVYKKLSLGLNIIPSPLHGVIVGGFTRHISRTAEKIVLDGSYSKDPDSLSQNHLRYKWDCLQLNKRNSSCFSDKHNIVKNESILVFPGSSLTTEMNDFEFRLTVSVPNSEKVIVSQVLHALNKPNILNVMVSCTTCVNNVMNANEKLTLETTCDNCGDDATALIYEWSIDRIINNNYNYQYSAHDCGKCVEANGSSYLHLRLNETDEADEIEPSVTTTTTTTTTTATTTKTTQRRTTTVKPTFPMINFDFPAGMIPDFHEGIIEEKSENSRSERGKSAKITSELKENRDDINNVVRPNQEKTELHIISKRRRKVSLSINDTLSMLSGQSLVIKPGVLSQGRDYLISVNVYKKDNDSHKGVFGIAAAHFHINESPYLGSCNIKPIKGTEMKTSFSAFCYEWKDEHQPLIYEISYNFEKGQRKNLLYRGLNATLNFMLPAGNPENDFKVNVFIAVVDSLGARTSVCFIPITVNPIENVAEDDLNNTLQRNLDEGDDRNARIFINMLAVRLNRLNPTNDSMRNSSWKTRHALLKILHSLPVRDEFETLQTMQAVESITLKTDELNLESASLALKILQSILDASKKLYDVMGHQTENLLQLAIDSLSNIVEASSTSVDSSKFIVKSSDVANGFITNELKFAAVEEKPIQHKSPGISIYAARYNVNFKPKLTIGEASFDLPEELTKLVDLNPKNDDEEPVKQGIRRKCYQAQMTSFHKKRYPLGSMETNKVQSQVTSLKLYSCDGKAIIVDHLPKEELITIGIPSEINADKTIGNHTLHRTHMNIHQFNVSKLNRNQSFHVLVNFTPVYSSHSGQLFPITVSISKNRPKKSMQYIFTKMFNPDENVVKIFLPSGELENGTYYLSIVDATYNEGRPRRGVATHRNYTLKLWWGQCLFWNKTDSKWSDSGCTDTSESTPKWTQCKCNHLTCFGSHSVPILNKLSFLNVEFFIDPYINPIPTVLTVVVLLVYSVLLFLCHKSDLHDAKKNGIIYLEDNSETDRQKYEIIVETGFRKGAGTTSKISVILHGEYGISETRELISEDEKPLFERNSRDKFVMTLPDSIGKLQKIQLWHNNSGTSPSWYLSRVILNDLNSGHTYYFVSERWFSVSKDDGRVERELWATKDNVGFNTIFFAKGAQYIADYHLWTSIITKPPHSRFTRGQRLSVCLTLLLSYMALNTLWYHFGAIEYRGEFGLLDVSWLSIAVGFCSCVLILPINWILVFLFRRTLIPYPGTEEDESYEDGKLEDTEMSHAVHIEPVMTYSPTPTILTLQNLQEWACRKWKKQQQEQHNSSTDSPLPHSENSSKPSVPSLREVITQEKNDILETDEADQVSSGFEDFNSQYHRSMLSADLLNINPKIDFTSSHATDMLNKEFSSQKIRLLQKSESSNTSHTSRRLFLPVYCRWIDYILCLLLSLGCAATIMYFGLPFSHTKCMMWLQSVYFSLTTCLFITHPFCILVITAYNAYNYRSNPTTFDHYDDGYYGEKPEYKKKKQPVCCEECKEFAARQRSRHLRFSRPPQKKQLLNSSKKSIKERKSYSFFRNAAVLGLMVSVLCVMAFGKGSHSSYMFNESLKNIFLRSGNQQFLGIKNVDQWWEWVQTSFLDQIYWDPWYSRDPQNLDMTYIADGNSYLLGNVNIRNLNRRQKPCQLQDNLWPILCEDLNNTQNGSRHAGRTLTKLSRQRSSTYKILMKLKKDGIINEFTQQIIVEFTLYNPPTNLFSSVSLKLQIFETGVTVPDFQIACTHLFRYISPLDNFILACELLFVILMLFSVKNLFFNVIRYHGKFLGQAWKVIDTLICVTSLMYMASYVYRFVLVSNTIEDLRSSFYQKYVDISFIAFWDELLKCQIGIVLFLSLVKFLSLSRYKQLFSMIESVYSRASSEILIFTCTLLVVMIAYTSLGCLAFGAAINNFQNFWSGFLAMTALLTHNNDFTEFNGDKYLGGKLFVVSYVVLAGGIFTAYIFAILSNNHGSIKLKANGVMSLRESLIFIWKKLLVWTGLRSKDYPDDGDCTLPAEFTLAEIEYQVDELLFHMNALLGLSGMPEKPMYYLTDSDNTSDRLGDDGISTGISGVSTSESEVRGEMLYEDRLEMRVQKIEENLCSNEPYLAPLIKGQKSDKAMLSPEKENELRSQLELKIFCQLQMQRQGHISPLYNERLGNDSSATSLQDSPSVDRSPSSVSDSSSSQQIQPQSPKLPDDIENGNDNSLSENVEESSSGNVQKPLLMFDPSSNLKQIPCSLKYKAAKTNKTGSISNNNPGKSKELPPKPTYKCNKLADSEAPPNYKAPMLQNNTNNTPAPILNFLRNVPESKWSSRRDNLVPPESSSGSELDAISHSRRLPGKRNLRKTKSKGKGKGGAASLVPIGLFEQLNLSASEDDTNDCQHAALCENIEENVQKDLVETISSRTTPNCQKEPTIHEKYP
ncbi:polycystic kidney disease protein 1-like 1 [Argonauta hians]